MSIDESARVECKESLNFGNRAEYARTIAGLANARGGFLLFGVRDADKAVTGIPTGKLAGYDSAQLTQYLSECFTPAPIWEKTEFEIAGRSIGIIYVRESTLKPIICTRNDKSTLREADIYYRYPGQTRRIRYAELVELLRERSQGTGREWADTITRVERQGVENVAILNTVTGEVSGKSGKFLISEELLPKLKFITEGNFSEIEGEPTLKLIGDLEPVSISILDSKITVITKIQITDFDLIDDFVNLRIVGDPIMYIRHLAYSAKIWLPVFYYIRQAGISDDDAAKILETEKGTNSKHIEPLGHRIRERIQPAGAPKKRSVEPCIT